MPSKRPPTKSKPKKGNALTSLQSGTGRLSKKTILIGVAIIGLAGAAMLGFSHASGTVLADEAFTTEASNFTTVAGGTWAVTGGKYALTNPAAFKDTKYGNANYALHSRTISGDFTASANILVPNSSSAYDDASVLVDWQDPSNYIYASLNERANDYTNGLFKIVGGVQTRLAAFTRTFAPGIAYNVSVARVGDTFTATVDGAKVGSAVDAAFPSGRFGIGTRNNAASFDNFNLWIPQDIQAPTVPTGLSTTSLAISSVTLGWVASSDNVAVSGYRVYANGVQKAPITGTSFQITGLAASTDYLLQVAAVDAAGNLSAKSPGVTVKTLAAPIATPTPALVTPTPMPATVSGTTKPDASNTGVPAGTALTVINGDYAISTAGAVVSGLDVRGFVRITADNVTFRNSIVRGRPFTSGNPSLLTSTHAGVLLENLELAAAYPQVSLDGLKGYGFTARRLNIHDTVDTAVVYGDNTTIESSWLHGNRHYLVDPAQNGGPSHDDNVQVEGGTNVRIVGNFMTGANNAVVQVTQNYALTTNLTIRNNWVDGGSCTINIAEKAKGALQGLAINANRFGRTLRYPSCAIIMPPLTGAITFPLGNVWDDTSLAVPVYKNGG